MLGPGLDLAKLKVGDPIRRSKLERGEWIGHDGIVTEVKHWWVRIEYGRFHERWDKRTDFIHPLPPTDEYKSRYKLELLSVD